MMNANHAAPWMRAIEAQAIAEHVRNLESQIDAIRSALLRKAMLELCIRCGGFVISDTPDLRIDHRGETYCETCFNVTYRLPARRPAKKSEAA